MLLHRVLSSAILLPILIISIFFGNPWFSIIVAIAAIIGVLEFYDMVSQAGRKPLTALGVLWTIFFIFNAYYSNRYDSVNLQLVASLGLACSAAIIFIIIVRLSRLSRENVTVDWAYSMAGTLYIGWLLSFWILIINSETWNGNDWVLTALLITFAIDTTAYFVGRAFGKHKLAPVISPGKTWEGALGGLFGALAAVFLLSLVLDIDIGYVQLFFIGIAVGILAQAGDLVESKLKRITGVKESGSIIPGHGGMLDRLDSIIFTGFVVYYCLRWFTA